MTRYIYTSNTEQLYCRCKWSKVGVSTLQYILKGGGVCNLQYTPIREYTLIDEARAILVASVGMSVPDQPGTATAVVSRGSSRGDPTHSRI